MLRLFWALLPPADVAAALEPAAHDLATRNPDLRWLAPTTWHVTVAFLGNVAPAYLDPLVAAVTDAVEACPPVPVTLSSGAGSAGGRAGVVWLPTEQDADATALASAVRAASGSVVPVDARRPWRGHLTLGRVPRGVVHPDRRAREVAGQYAGPTLRWTAHEVVLRHSRTSPGGAEHRTVATVPLG